MREIIKAIILSCILTIFLRTVLPINICKVNGNSMNPTYEDGDIILIYKNKEILRYDIVIVKTEDDGKIIKRVVGLPNDIVEIRTSGKVYINGIESEFSIYQAELINIDEDIKVHLKEDEYFVIGDNVNHSLDSRVLGAIKENNILFSIPINKKNK